MIDCCVRPSPLVDAVNVGGTDLIIALCKGCCEAADLHIKHRGAVWCAGVGNACDNCPEDAPYPPFTTQEYQRTKIAAERLVLAANERSNLQAVSLRPGRIFGPGDDLFFMTSVQACFGESKLPSLGPKEGALMSMVYVENMAAAHILAAILQLAKGVPRVAGALSTSRTSTRTSWPRTMMLGGVGLRGLLLSGFCICSCAAVFAAIVCYDLFGLQILHPKTGLHEAALSAGLPATVNDRLAKSVLGHRPLVSGGTSNQQCCRWLAGGGARGAKSR